MLCRIFESFITCSTINNRSTSVPKHQEHSTDKHCLYELFDSLCGSWVCLFSFSDVKCVCVLVCLFVHVCPQGVPQMRGTSCAAKNCFWVPTFFMWYLIWHILKVLIFFFPVTYLWCYHLFKSKYQKSPLWSEQSSNWDEYIRLNLIVRVSLI